MAKNSTNVAAKSSKPAKSAPVAAPTASTGAKVGKLDKSKAAAAPAKPAKGGEQAPARGKASAQGQAKARSQYATKKIRLLTPKGETPAARGNALAIYNTVARFAGKSASEALGQEYQRGGGKYDTETWTVLGSDLAYLERRGLVAFD